MADTQGRVWITSPRDPGLIIQREIGGGTLIWIIFDGRKEKSSGGNFVSWLRRPTKWNNTAKLATPLTDAVSEGSFLRRNPTSRQKHISNRRITIHGVAV